jgi:hypothetical protein
MLLMAGSTDRHWLLTEETESTIAVKRLGEAGAEGVAVIDAPLQALDAATDSDNLFVIGVGCGDDTCGSASAQLFRVSSSGVVDVLGEVDSHPGPPSGSDAVEIIGILEDTLFVQDMQGRLLSLDRDGTVIGEPARAHGELCIIDSDLYQITPDGEPSQPGTESDVAEPATVGPTGFSIGRWAGQGFDDVPNGRLERSQSPGGAAFCMGDAFEVEGPNELKRWSPNSGWVDHSPFRWSPEADRTGTAASSTGHRYFVDAGGRLQRIEGDHSVPMALVFAIERGEGPPLGLLVDDAGGDVVACVHAHTAESGTGTTECSFGRS